jgi:hypothetical protein
MTKIDDELLNRYIDNELDGVELSELKSILDKDEEALARLKALRTVDNSLRHIETELAPNGFTEKLMDKISTASKMVKPKVSYFFVTIISIFSVAIISTIVFAFKNLKTNESQSNANPVFDQIKDFANKNFSFLESLFKENAVLTIGTMLSLILLFAAFFSFESYKNFKNKLNSFSH